MGKHCQSSQGTQRRGDGQGTHGGQCPAGAGTGPPRALRHWRGDPGSQSTRPGWFSCVAAPPGAMLPGLLLLLLGRVTTSSPSLGPLCVRWCKLTAALGRQCVRPGQVRVLPKASSPSYWPWVCLKQWAAPLGPRVLPPPPHPFCAPRFARGPVKTGPVGNVADEETDVPGPGGMERWLRVSRAREQRGRVVKDSSWEIFFSSTDKASAPALGATGTMTEQTLTAENFCFGEGDDGQGSNQFSR